MSEEVITTKVCTKCGQEKLLKEFYKAPASKGKYGRHSYCKVCMVTYSRWRKLKYIYNISKTQYNDLLERQHSRCAICGVHVDDLVFRTPKHRVLHVDHNHKTGEVRGLLCNDCNVMVGCSQDNTENLKKAIDYLQMKGGK